jgi:hypothetical protein
MPLRLLRHIRSNLIGYLALFAALSGTSYAALSLPAGSVGTRELRNRAITAAKLNPTSVTANVRAWATLVWTGAWRITASSSDIRVVNTTQGEVVTWRHTRFPRNCIAVATPIRNPSLVPPVQSAHAYVTTSFDGQLGSLAIDGVTPSGAFQPQSVGVLIECPTPGSQKVGK